MKTLRLIRFYPATESADLYWQDGDFRSNTPLAIADLDPAQQAAVVAALSWAIAQLPPGFAALESVELRRVGDVVTAWSTPEEEGQPPVPLSYSPAFVAAIVGNGPAGQAALEIVSSPGPEAVGLAALWDHLAAGM